MVLIYSILAIPYLEAAPAGAGATPLALMFDIKASGVAPASAGAASRCPPGCAQHQQLPWRAATDNLQQAI